MLSHSPDETRDILVASADHSSVSARRTVAEALPRIHSQQRELALVLADRLLLNDDLSVIILTASFVGGLARLSEEEFVPRANVILESGVERAVQRLVESGLRDYLSANPSDPHSMLVTAWLVSSQVGRSRVGNLIAEQAGVAPAAFVATCSSIFAKDTIAYGELLRWIEMRNPESLELL
jgi:hypothetical protein